MDETWLVLWRLGSRQRTALVLRFYEDLDVASVARAMGCRLPAARSLIHRGLASLRTELEER
jgi:DNA-directed RNA polymerase specialized sigma24 family protein